MAPVWLRRVFVRACYYIAGVALEYGARMQDSIQTKPAPDSDDTDDTPPQTPLTKRSRALMVDERLARGKIDLTSRPTTPPGPLHGSASARYAEAKRRRKP